MCGMDFELPRPHSGPDRELEAALNDVAYVSCPYCGESSELVVDPGGGASQEYVEDCEVCCRPWLVRIRLSGDGDASVSVATLDPGHSQIAQIGRFNRRLSSNSVGHLRFDARCVCAGREVRRIFLPRLTVGFTGEITS